jgi:hypothetical protein
MTTPIDEMAGPCQYVIALTGAPCGERRLAAIHMLGWHDARPDRPVHDYTFTDRRVRDRRSTPVPASNVSEGLREDAREKAIVNAWREAQRLHGDWSASWQADSDRARHFLAALAHAAPEGLDVERLRRAIDNVNEMDPLDYLDAGDTVDAYIREFARLSQPDTTEEAGR